MKKSCLPLPCRWRLLVRFMPTSTVAPMPLIPKAPTSSSLSRFPTWAIAGSTGVFNDFDGEFVYDAENPENSTVNVTIDTSSVDSNHAERDKHLRSEDFLYVDEFPQATFKSKRVVLDEEGEADIIGDLTLRGVTKEVTLDAEMLGHGEDPWGGYRMGFEAETELRLKDFGIPMDLGKASETVEIIISVEGIRQ